MPVTIAGDLPYVLYENGKLYAENEEIIPDYFGEYPCWRLSIDGNWVKFACHRLMAQSFIPNPDHLPVVNHLNGNKRDWSLDNLEWTTQRENVIHAHSNDLVSTTCSRQQVHEICQMIQAGFSNAEIAREMGITQGAVCNIRNNRRHREISKEYW